MCTLNTSAILYGGNFRIGSKPSNPLGTVGKYVVLAPAERTLVAELFDRTEVADLVQAALDGSIAFVPLQTRPKTEGPAPIELRAPQLSAPIVLCAHIAGNPTGDMFPVFLSPLADSHRRPLSDFVEAVRRTVDVPSEPPERRSSIPAPRTRPPPPPQEIPPPDPPPDPMLGRSLGNGRYLIERLLGVGGMGRVYLARHTALAKPIALKVLDTTFQQDPQFAGRFHQEALAASQLDHRNVMRVIDFGQEPEGLMYIAMELLRGENLGTLIERQGVSGFPLPRIIQIMTQVCAALAEAHDRDIVHRDMKPENVMLVEGRDDDGRPIELVKVCDFGLAKMQEGGQSGASPGPRRKLTIAGTIMGTPHYMSPEQCRGLPTDHRTDIYACGVMLYELSTGSVPFNSENPMDILGMHCMAPVLSPRVLNPAVDPRLEASILRAMSKDREQRQTSVRELRDELRVLLSSPAGVSGAAAHAGALGAAARAQMLVEGADQEIPIEIEEPARVGPPVADTAVGARPVNAGIGVATEMPRASPQPRSSEGDALVHAAEALITGDQTTRERARVALISVGTPGVRALIQVRERMSVDATARSRWVTTVRETGQEAIEPLTEKLRGLDPLDAKMDPALAEDLLRAVPDASNSALAGEVKRFVFHGAVAIRRAALGALVALKARDAGDALLRSLGDRDPAVQMVAVNGFRKLGGINRAVVEKLDVMLTAPNASEELQAAAAAALSEADASAKVPAESALLRALQPRGRGLMDVLRGDVSAGESTLAIEAVAVALLRVGGPAARRAVEKRAAQSRGEVKRRLEAVLAGK